MTFSGVYVLQNDGLLGFLWALAQEKEIYIPLIFLIHFIVSIERESPSCNTILLTNAITHASNKLLRIQYKQYNIYYI